VSEMNGGSNSGNGGGEIDLRGLKILVVDDIPDNQTLLKRRLQRCGAQVESAENGLEGVTMALQRQYDLILMDIQMPVVDGLTATSHLRKCGFKKPIVACTAHSDERSNALNNFGFDDFFAKPLDLTALVNRLRRFHISDILRNAQVQ
jgi:CheY-like chemotaxis protein